MALRHRFISSRFARPRTFEECVLWSRGLFEDHFVLAVNRLLRDFPLDFRSIDGNLFWTGRRRSPNVFTTFFAFFVLVSLSPPPPPPSLSLSLP